MSSRSWDGVRLRRRGWKHTHTHMLSCSFPCKHVASLSFPSLSIPWTTFIFLFFFLPPPPSTSSRDTIPHSCESQLWADTQWDNNNWLWGKEKEKKKDITVQTPPLFSAVNEQSHTYFVQVKYWWRGWGNVHALVLLGSISPVDRTLVSGCNYPSCFSCEQISGEAVIFFSQYNLTPACILHRRSYNARAAEVLSDSVMAHQEFTHVLIVTSAHATVRPPSFWLRLFRAWGKHSSLPLSAFHAFNWHHCMIIRSMSRMCHTSKPPVSDLM